MKHQMLENYLQNELPTFLKGYEIPEEAIKIVVDDIRPKIYSFIFHWNDVTFRKAFLIIGEEEATYYEPFRNIPLKSFIVLTIRNSQIENLVSTSEAAELMGMKKPSYLEGEMKKLSQHAIKYFETLDFIKLSSELTIEQDEDFYGNLAANFPYSFKALSEIGNTKACEVRFDKMDKPFYNIPELMISYRENIKPSSKSEVLSGASSVFTPNIIDVLLDLNKHGIFYAASFKGITRNIEKLFKIMEYVLSRNYIFVINNYYLTNGFVAKRKKLLRPGHFSSEDFINFKNIQGLTKKHKKTLSSIYI